MDRTAGLEHAYPLLVVFGISLAWFSFWTCEQPFFDDDYGRWLLPAMDHSAGRLLSQIVIPFPPDWGFLDRPMILLFFKAGYALFGAEAGGYFLLKSLIAAALATMVFLLSRRLSVSDARSDRSMKLLSFVPWLFFLTAEPVFKCMLWLCDLEVLAQLCVALSLWLYMRYRSLGLHTRPPAIHSLLFQLLIFLVALIGFNTKSSAKLIPLIIFAHALWMDRRRVLHFLPLVVAMVIVNVPWGIVDSQPLPEFLSPGTTSEVPSYFWSRPSWETLRELLIGTPAALWPFGDRARPDGMLHVLFPFGIVVIGLTLIAGVRARIGKPAIGRPASGNPTVENQAVAGDRRSRSEGAGALLTIWLVLSLVALSIYPNVPPAFRNRYLVAMLIPTVLAIGFSIRWAIHGKSASRLFTRAVAVSILAQCAMGVWQTRQSKVTLGAELVLRDRVRAHIEDNYRQSDFVYLFLADHGYWPSKSGNRYLTLSEPDDELFRELSRSVSAGRPVYRIVAFSEETPRWERDAEVGLEPSLYGRILGVDVRKRVRYIDRLKTP